MQYSFWHYKTAARVTDPEKRAILCPAEPPHPWGTKRPSLEQDFYEQMDKPNVHVIDINKNPVKEVVPEGIVTEDGKLHQFDIIALATGFDSVTGGMKNMGLKDVNGKDLGEKWKDGTYSYMGMTCAGFPNMFFLYGAQGPTAFSNGPTCVEVQGGWIFDAIDKMRKEHVRSIEAKPEAETEWHKLVKDSSDATLFPLANSWYMGANIPGKPREQVCPSDSFVRVCHPPVQCVSLILGLKLNWTAGFPRYSEEISKGLDGWHGFTVVKA